MRQPTIAEQLRAAVEQAEDTRYRIALETGIAQSVLSRFMSGETAPTLSTLERLAAYLDLHLVRGRGKNARPIRVRKGA